MGHIGDGSRLYSRGVLKRGLLIGIGLALAGLCVAALLLLTK